MATTTYFSALSTIIDFAVSHGFNDKDVIEKVEKLRDQKQTKSKTGEKSQARKDNENFAKVLVQTMQDKDVNEIRAAWVKDNVEGINTVPKGVAVLNVAVDLGLLASRTVAKSATRNEIVYYLPTEQLKGL